MGATKTYWEVYATRAQAVEALQQGPPQPQPRTLPTAKFPLLVMEDVGGVMCIRYDYKVWTANAVILQAQLKALVTDCALDRVVLDFAGQNRVGTPSQACIFALYSAVRRAGGRISFCSVETRLLEFFQWRGNPLAMDWPEASRGKAGERQPHQAGH